MNEKDFLRYKTWAVVGDVLNEQKYAYEICRALEAEGYQVAKVNPRSKSPLVYKQLSDVPQSIEVIDLVIHPKLGLKVLEEAVALGIKQVLVQPGAESDGIRDYAQKHQLTLVEGCVLRALVND